CCSHVTIFHIIQEEFRILFSNGTV
ncbi:hypothetical protein TcasGA2_TC034973, partial [Tribolium castaneum]